MADMQDGSGAAVLLFLEWCRRKGLMNANTASAQASAVTKILAIDDDREPKDIDIQQLDIDQQLERFVRLKGAEYTPGSLATYKTRFRKALELYQAWLADPASFRGTTTLVVRRRTGLEPRDADVSQPSRVAKPVEVQTTSDEPEDLMPGAKLPVLTTYPFPLESGETAYLRLPRSISENDVRRLSQFLLSLVVSAGTASAE